MTKRTKKNTPVQTAFDEWHKDPEYVREYIALAAQFIKAHSVAGLTLRELADHMKTTQAYIARLEGGKEKPSTRTLNRFAEATDIVSS